MSAAKAINVILVHGAWADGASWTEIVAPLEGSGFRVTCAPLPLRTLHGDIEALQRVIDRTDGPVVLTGHAYAGAVIGGVTDERVKLLLYVAALAPDEKETVAEVFYRDEPPPERPKLSPDLHGDIWMSDQGFSEAFAPEARPERLAILRATQRPIAAACIQEAAPKPRWKEISAWFLIAELDRMIHPNTQRFMAGRMRATVRTLAAGHTPLVTAPDAVVRFITEAVQTISASEKSQITLISK